LFKNESFGLVKSMASYKIVPIKQRGIDPEVLTQRLQAHSALNDPNPREVDAADPRSGPLPHTVKSFDQGIQYFEYGREKVETYIDLAGNEQESIRPARYPVFFLGNRYVAMDAYCPEAVEIAVLSLLNELLDTEIQYEVETFGRNTLRSVIKQAEHIEQADFDTESIGMPDRVSGKHRAGLTQTNLWPDYGSEPVQKVKVSLPRNTSRNVGFDEEGVITIYGKEVPAEKCGTVLRYVTDEIIANLGTESFQRKLGGEEL
jgi:hypothetical protein